MSFAERTLPEWTEFMRELIQREGRAVQAGRDNTIEVQSFNTGEWHTINLTNGKPFFTTTAERDTALARIQTP
ncbi:MAG: hypothetical protein WC205_16760 [Opitutaceae bacterium]|jgi:hypothetical protein